MIYLDTHVVVWLYAGLTEKLSRQAISLINDHDLFISPVVRLELGYLFESDRISDDASRVYSDLKDRIGLNCCTKPFNAIIEKALSCSWTRDPFDRIIVANAGVEQDILVTKDSRILANYTQAVW